MAKAVYNYVFMMTGLALLLAFSGIEVAGVTSLLSKLSLIEGSISSQSAFSTRILTILASAVTGGIVIGLITRSNPENYLLLGIITGGTVAITIFSTLGFAIINAGYSYASWIGHITVMLVGTMSIGFFFSLLDWFRGTD